MRKIVRRSSNLEPQDSGDEEVFIRTKTLLAMIYEQISPDGGAYKTAFLAEQLDLPDFSLKAKENLVQRALEWSLKTEKGKRVPLFVGVHARSGRLAQRRPFED